MKGLMNEPKRCPSCRLVERGRRAGKQVKLIDVICAECGAATQVTFVPTGVRPVLCSQCLHKHKPAPAEHLSSELSSDAALNS